MRFNISKRIICLSVASLMFFGSAGTTHAALHKEGCSASRTIQKCDYATNQIRDRHQLHKNAYCDRIGHVYAHKIVCAGCGAKVKKGDFKLCFRTHKYCPTEKHMCK